MIVEFWLVRVLLHRGRNSLPPRAGVLAAISRGELACLPDGCIAEPVEQFAREELAHEACERRKADDPSSDYRVIINTSIDNGGRA